jgi:hypothetical protein
VLEWNREIIKLISKGLRELPAPLAVATSMKEKVFDKSRSVFFSLRLTDVCSWRRSRSTCL